MTLKQRPVKQLSMNQNRASHRVFLESSVRWDSPALISANEKVEICCVHAGLRGNRKLVHQALASSHRGNLGENL
jgi:hypothetical protein